jgi:aminobenzoyl-glutamate utilization protein B
MENRPMLTALAVPKLKAHRWVEDHHQDWSSWNFHLWDLAETAWREYRSAEWYVSKLKAEGFHVEVGSGGMPTAFSATWSSGPGPTIMAYAEYDAVPGNCQKAATYRAPREGLSRFAAGHTDPHSALGMGALVGTLAAKAAMEQGDVKGSLRFMGEPAEKMRGSKPIHAARGYYDGLDAIISFHPFYMLPLCNTARWDTHCGPFYCVLYEFLCEEPEVWLARTAPKSGPIPAAHAEARAPGANDAAIAMYTSSKMLRDHMLPHTGTWSVNEIILASGQATADNLAAQMSQIVFAARASSLEELEKILFVLDRNATAAAAMSHCTVRRHWISKSRGGLANHAMAEIVYRNLAEVGAPKWNERAVKVAQSLQKELGLDPLPQPFIPEIEQLIDPKTAEARLRTMLPRWQTHFTSDDYTDMSWHAPTARFYVGRPGLRSPPGYTYPDWAMNALGGIPETIDPTVDCAAKVVAGTILDLMIDKESLAHAKAEFVERTGGGIGGSLWQKPLCDYPPPIDFPWPRYFDTPAGRQWCIPENEEDRKLHR